jgi:hypothetical protein
MVLWWFKSSCRKESLIDHLSEPDDEDIEDD